jgi:WD40 repeat protein
MITRFLLLWLSAHALAIGAPLSVSEMHRDDRVNFAREIYPLLKKNCLACHNSTKAKADLNLESPALMRKGGESGPAIIAGKADESLLLKSAAHLDDPPMPPPGNKVKAANLSPDELGLLKLWINQGAQGEALAAEKGPLPWRMPGAVAHAVNALEISPDGKCAAMARGNTVQLCELATGTVTEELADPDLMAAKAGPGPIADRDAVMAVAFATNDLLATGGFRTARIWRHMPRATRREYAPLPEEPRVVAVSQDGQRAAVGAANGTVSLLALPSEKVEPMTFKAFETAIVSLAFCDGSAELLAVNADGDIAQCRVAERAVISHFSTPVPSRAVGFDRAESELFVLGSDGTVRVWAWPLLQMNVSIAPVREIKTANASAFALSAAGENAFWWMGADGVLHLGSTRDGTEVRRVTPEHPLARKAAAAERVLKLAQTTKQSRAARLAALTERLKKETEAARNAAQIAVKKQADAEQQLDTRNMAEELARAAPNDKGRAEAAKKAVEAESKSESAARAAKVDAEIAVRLSGATAQEHAIAQADDISADAELAAAQSAREAVVKKMSEPLPVSAQLAIALDGRSASITDASGGLRVVALDDGTLLEPPGTANGCVYLPGGEMLLAEKEKRLRHTSAGRTWQRERLIGNPDDPTILEDRVNAVAFSPDGKLLATAGGTPSRSGELKLWRTDGTLVRAIAKAHADTINAVAFSPDGELFATAGSDRAACIWSTRDGTRVASLEGHAGHVLSVAWRADGLVLATSGSDKTVRTWDLLTRKQIKAVTNFGGEVCAVRFVGTGDLLLTAAGDKTVRLGEQTLPESTGGYPFCATADLSGTMVGAGWDDGVVRVWNVSDRKLWKTIPPVESSPPRAGKNEHAGKSSALAAEALRSAK